MTQPAPGYFTSRQSVLRRSFERSYSYCQVTAPSEGIATVHLQRASAPFFRKCRPSAALAGAVRAR